MLLLFWSIELNFSQFSMRSYRSEAFILYENWDTLNLSYSVGIGRECF